MMGNKTRAVCLRVVELFFLVAAVVMLTAVASEAEAQGEPPLLTLQQSIEIALERNFDMQLAREEIHAAQEGRKEAGTGFLPSFSGRYSYRRLSEDPYAVLYADRNQYRLTGTVKQPLFTGFAILSNYRLAVLGLDVARIRLAQARLDLILQVKEAYFGILSAEKIHEVAEQAVQQLQAQLDVAENFYRVGRCPKVDVLDAEVRLAEAMQQLIWAANDLRLSKARFNTILNRTMDQEVAVADILSDQPYEKPYESCLKISLQNRPELMEAEKNVAKAEKEITLAKSAYYPNVSISGNYYRAGDDPDVGGSDFVDRENWDVMAEATISFFEWGKTRYAVNQKRTRLRQAKQTLQQMVDIVYLEVKTNYLNLQTAERNISVAQKSVESAEENFRISGERYRQQVATATEVLDAQTRLSQARTNHTKALVEFNVARARLIRAMGFEDES